MFFAVLCIRWERVADLPNDLAMSTWLCPSEKLVAFGQAAVQEETLCADVFPEGTGIPSVAWVVLCNVFVCALGMMDMDGQVDADG